MGRSKFPGKPLKHVNRTRVNVLPSPPAADSPSTGTNVRVDKEDVELDTSKDDGTVEATPRRRRMCASPYAGRKKSSLQAIAVLRKRGQLKQGHGETGNLVGKFVLPTRSVHSSRVIKPNKRFINVDAVSGIGRRNFKKRMATKRNSALKSDQQQLECAQQDQALSDSDGKMLKVQNTRVILRQARLQLHTQTQLKPEGPFSSKGNPAGTVTCGVCGAVRHYRFVKQARKFNIYSCEACRKFILKMIKRQSCSDAPTLACHTGQGMCHIPAMIAMSQRKLLRPASTSRCPACWLKLCLRSFQIPTNLKTGLSTLLPESMREPNSLFNNSLKLFSWNTTSSLEHKIQIKETVKTEPLLQQRTTRLKVKTIIRATSPFSSALAKRQKIDLKGPRVKNVCRSASKVLGQPLATFPVNSAENVPSEPAKVLPKPIVIDAKGTKEKKSTSQVKNADATNEPKVIPKLENPVKQERNKTHKSILYVEMKPKPVPKKLLPPPNINAICMDFWEYYDPEEVCRNGFGLISTESFPMRAICYLCGSAGQEQLLYCCVCCEPYHTFCLDQEPQNLKPIVQRCNWMCPRCTNCSACGQPDKLKISCQKCHKLYHPECFNTKWKSDDRPQVCSTCLICKGCGKNNITKFIGNMPLCVMCFKLRKKGNFCPICQGCYEDNEYESQMMECEKCGKWIHAKCEGIAEEQYHMLSLLPESVAFICCLCAVEVPYWRHAINAELHMCFNTVLRKLSKNKSVRNMIKWSPLRVSEFCNKPIHSARKLQFSSETDSQESAEETDSDNKVLISDVLGVQKEIVTSIPSARTSSITDIKNKVYNNEFSSLHDFNKQMEKVLNSTNSMELLSIYYSILKKEFPWFNLAKDIDILVAKSAETPSKSLKSPQKMQLDSNHKVTNVIENDQRACVFCKGVGDGPCFQEGRQLYCGHNEWVHANCALWSSEVYEEIDGSLQNVHSAISRSRSLICTYCKKKGASIGCCVKECHANYHFSCAYQFGCIFMHDKTVYCKHHTVTSDSPPLASDEDLDIRRSVYVELDRKTKKYVQPEKVQYMVGSLTVKSLGKIVSYVSDNVEAIIPCGFVCSRLYWSAQEPWKLVPYVITTSVLSAEISSIVTDRNFTIDHSLSKTIVDQALKDLIAWQKEFDKDVNMSEFDDEEERQNEHAPDILSPELTDAILEELPHEFLDGISLQDIFPKIMNNDELGLDIGDHGSELYKKLDEFTETDQTSKSGRVLKEVFQKYNTAEKMSKARSQQRSCGFNKKPARRENINFQLIQADGAYDSSSGSECGSPPYDSEHCWAPELSDGPVKCKQCQCTYRTQDSYKRHLATCEAMSTSDSDSEISHEPDSVEIAPAPLAETREVIEVASTQTSESYIISSYEEIRSFETGHKEINTSVFCSETTGSIATSEVGCSTYQHGVEVMDNPQCVAQITSNHTVCESLPDQQLAGIPRVLAQTQTYPVCQAAAQANSTLCLNQRSLYVNQPNSIINQNNTISLIASADSSEIEQVPVQAEVQPCINIATQSQTSSIVNSFVAQTVTVPQSHQYVRQPKPAIVTHSPPKAACKRLPPQRPVLLRKPAQPTPAPPSAPAPPSIVVQHLPSAVVPSFIDGFHQQTGHNLQYIATLTPQQFVQIESGSNIVNVVPNMQPTVIIQQPRVMTADQLVMDSNGSLMFVQNPLTPIIYGFETIVQNTIMQSQQFLPNTMPGLLTTNSSYSSTTQVIQTNKFEPVLDVATGNIVLVNSGSTANTQPVQVSQNIVNHIASAPGPSEPRPSPPQPWKRFEPTVAPPPHPKPAPITSSSASNYSSINLPVGMTQDRPLQRVFPMNSTNANSKKFVAKPVATNGKITKPPPVVQPKKPPEVTEKQQEEQESPPRPKVRILEDVVLKAPQSQKASPKPAIEEALTKMDSSDCADQLPQINNSIMPELPKPDMPSIAEMLPVLKIQELPEVELEASPCEEMKPLPPEKIPSDCQKPAAKELKLPPPKAEPPQIPAILYTVETQDGFRYSSTSITEMWTKIFEAVQRARADHNMVALPQNTITNNLQLLGLKTNGLKHLLEQLPEANKCIKYKPRFHTKTSSLSSEEDISVEHPYGGIRCAPFQRAQEPNDLFGWLASKHRTPSDHFMFDAESSASRRASMTHLPMATRFRQLKETYKKSVGVYRSNIHKRGLFCHRDIEAMEMVIEYAGEVIRSGLADKREKEYNAKGIGCYMFRIDDNFVIDATKQGNAARFINHSCDPNCFSKVVDILGHKHIIIFALRRILQGEELTYDYKFQIEEDKIPCTCGSRKCRKFLN